MRPDADANFPVTTPELLDDLTEAPLPQGLREVGVSKQVIRDTYFDTADEQLGSQGISCRFRVVEGRGPAVILTRRSPGAGGTTEARSSVETPAVGSGFYETMRGNSDLATRVRAVVEPTSLRPVVAVQIQRTVRQGAARVGAKPVVELWIDRLTVQVRDTTRTFQELTVHRLRPGGPTLRGMAEELRAFHGLEPDGLDTLQRALRERSAAQADVLRAAAPSDRSVALLALRGDEVGLLPGTPDLMIPMREGSGEEVALAILTGLLHVTAPGVTRLGFAASRRGGEPLEVWLAEGCEELRPGVDPDGDVYWFPLHELMERVGSPGLRDPALLSVLLRLERSNLSTELGTAGPSGLATLRSLPLPRDLHTELDPASPDPEHFLDPDLSALELDERVLELAESPDLTWRDRIHLLSAFSRNLDEFFAVRLERFHEPLDGASWDGASPPGFVPRELLDAVSIRIRAMTQRQYGVFVRALLPVLAREGIRLKVWSDLAPQERQRMASRFESEILPLLTATLLSDTGASAPTRFLGPGIAMIAALHEPKPVAPGDGAESRERRHAIVRIPDSVPRFVQIPSSSDVVAVEELVRAGAAALFPGADVESVHAFRVFRWESGSFRSDRWGLLESAHAEPLDVRASPALRVEIERSMPRAGRAALLHALRRDRRAGERALCLSDIYSTNTPIHLAELEQLAAPPVPSPAEAGQPPVPQRDAPTPPPGLAGGSGGAPVAGTAGIAGLAEGELLVREVADGAPPSLLRFVGDAATDPEVVALRLLIRGTSPAPAFVGAILEARRADTDVAVFVDPEGAGEAGARAWRRALESERIPVVPGLRGIPTRCSAALVVRREGGIARRYACLATGGTSVVPGSLRAGLQLLSGEPDLTADLNELFNALTASGRPPFQDFRRLLVSPHTLLPGLLDRIEREIEHAREGRPARVRAKLQGLTDVDVIQALYRASQAGVEVALSVRGVCSLRPGIPGLSDEIRVVSRLNGHVEDARVYQFGVGTRAEQWVGSADWRFRSLRQRVELAVRIADPSQAELLESLLDAEMAEPGAWDLRPDGAYARRTGTGHALEED